VTGGPIITLAKILWNVYPLLGNDS
jgi:hypothetical protein